MTRDITVVFVVAVLVSLVIGPEVIRLLRRLEVVDVPGQRSSHDRPTVRGAGLAPAVGGLLAWTVASTFIDSFGLLVVTIVAVGVIAAVGLVDDLTGGWPAGLRLVLVLAPAAGAIGMVSADSVDGSKAALLATGGALFVVAFTNAFNFMDGIDGISVLNAAAMAVILIVVAARDDDQLVTVLAAGLLGSALGFGPFNLRKPVVFLGDVGSYFFGAGISIVAVAAVLRGVPLEAGGAFFIPYVLDTLVTFVRRQRQGARWNDPHRDHAYQRLVQRGHPHRTVAAGVAALTLGCGLLGILADLIGGPARIVLVGAVFVLAAAYVALPSLLGDDR